MNWLLNIFDPNANMDFVGQKHAERFYQITIVVFTIVGLIVGFYFEDFYYTFQLWAVGTIISAVVTLFPWPCFRRNPVVWLPEKKDD
jgi:signal peptidase complex subunit 1